MILQCAKTYWVSNNLRVLALFLYCSDSNETMQQCFMLQISLLFHWIVLLL